MSTSLRSVEFELPVRLDYMVQDVPSVLEVDDTGRVSINFDSANVSGHLRRLIKDNKLDRIKIELVTTTKN